MPVTLYHFTHIDNLQSIVATDALVCDTRVQGGHTDCTDVGDHEVKARRRTRPVNCGPGGVVADYVPFYFAPRSPMLYVINKSRVPQYQGGQDPLVYLVTTVQRVQATDRPIVFTDGNAASTLSEFFDDPAQLANRIDWDLMESRYWNDTLTHPDRMRRRMAEALVHDYVPWSAFTECVTKTSATAVQVRQVVNSPRVRVEPGWYY